ncbi:hypothetical protein HDU76_013223 [Blyttiomyces sp. JEL0837]|nr:hypothetical protein HDU76_013223 [Blyttiomyces sp. JEL0837]
MRPSLLIAALFAIIFGIVARVPFIRQRIVTGIASTLTSFGYDIPNLHTNTYTSTYHATATVSTTTTTSLLVRTATATLSTTATSTAVKTDTEKHDIPDFPVFKHQIDDEVQQEEPTRNAETTMSNVERKVIQQVLSVEQAEGVGARVRRSIGTYTLRNLDPFLMLDEFAVSAPAGFPDHPHRGFETITYMLEGSFQHEDFTGRSGILILVMGLQLWLNLPKAAKMIDPNYQELKDSEIPKAVSEDGSIAVKVIAGESMGVKAKIHTFSPIYYLDFKIKAGGKFEQPIPGDYTTFVYTLVGKALFGAEKSLAEPHTTLVFNEVGNTVGFQALDEDVHFVLIAGKPLKEPIVQHGPFVMNEKSEIYQAFMDYQNGQNGFERAPGWESKIGNAH